MEYGINELSDENIKIYNKVKEETNDGKYSYINIHNNQDQRLIVKATKLIKSIL